MVNTEQKMQDYLKEVLIWSSQEDNEIKTIDTFEEIGVMTNNKGLLVRMQDGSRFQLVIVKSR
jgi:hypothetical protein